MTFRSASLRAGVLALITLSGVAGPAAGGDVDDEGSGALAREVTYRLTRAEIVESGVLMVRAERGVVELHGRVRSRALIGEAEQVAAGVDGVDEVINRLKVAGKQAGGGRAGGNEFLPDGKAAKPVDQEQEQEQEQRQQDADEQRGGDQRAARPKNGQSSGQGGQGQR